MENVPQLEVHYYLRDELHSMDAFVRNRCEAEFLAAVSYIAESLGASLQFEATVPTEGGFRDIWTVLLHKDNRAMTVATITTVLNLLINGAIQIWNAPPKSDPELERQQLQINRQIIQHWDLENQRSALELKKLQREVDAAPSTSTLPPAPSAPSTSTLPAAPSAPAAVTSSIHAPAPSAQPVPMPAASAGVDGEPKRLSLQMDPKVNKRRSNFYKQLITYERVTAVGVRWLPDDQPTPEERIISRLEFSGFLLATDTLEPEVTEAVIEIVSPVITEGDIQWKGRWNGQTIAFAMDDKAFKDAVFHKQIKFQHGDSIRCVLESERKLDEGGNPKVKGHRVLTVLDKIESGGKAYETPQGRRKRFEDKHADGQAGLFGHDDV